MTFWPGIFITCVYVYLCLDRARKDVIFGKADNSSESPDSSEKLSLNTSEESVGGNRYASECPLSYNITSGNSTMEDSITRFHAHHRCLDRCNKVCYNPAVDSCVDNRLDCSCLARCNNECYNPKILDCVDNKLCPTGQIMCHFNSNYSSCYDPSREQSCHILSQIVMSCQDSGGLYCGEACYDRSEGNCKGACYSPESGAKCYRGDTLCQAGEEYCGRNCYDPKNGTICHEGRTLCKKNESFCRGNCYDPSSGAICYGGRTLCQRNESVCGYKCYDAASGAICYDGRTLCQRNESVCGYNCYDPTTGAVCCNDKILCKKYESACGRNCYDPTTGVICYNDKVLCQQNESICGDKCYNQESGDICHDKILCHRGESVCRYSCYDPNVENCFHNTITCRHGMQSCGDFLCMWPHNETCHEQENPFDTRPCPNSEKLCGENCYNPEDSTCSDGKLCQLNSATGRKCVNGVVCEIHEKVCNGLCYDPIQVGKHARCRKKYVHIKRWNVWYVNDDRVIEFQTGGGSVADSEEFICDSGYEKNMNGECQHVLQWKGGMVPKSEETVDSGEDYSEQKRDE